VYFDPKAGAYQMLTSESVALTVTGEAAAPGTIVPPPATVNASAGGADRVPVPMAPPPLPLDPIAGARLGLPPLASSSLMLLLVVPLVVVVAWWLRLAASRRYATDPQRRRRDARARIEVELAHLAGAASLSRAQIVQHLRAWQHAAAEFAEIAEASPTPAQIAGALEHVRTGSSWAQLWRDANHVIYGETQTLPADWLLRAQGALSDAPLADVPLLALFLRRNLFPWAALLVFACWPFAVRAEAGAEAYRAGDFKKAEAAWRSALAASPRDAAPRAQQHHARRRGGGGPCEHVRSCMVAVPCTVAWRTVELCSSGRNSCAACKSAMSIFAASSAAAPARCGCQPRQPCR
jgi:hypothetical protein